jgi:hypothetical protein
MSSLAVVDIPDVNAVASTGNLSAPGEDHIPSLDGVRALAFLIVFISHAGLKDLVPGGFGVTIFFVLSGYLITSLLRVEVERYGEIDIRSFYLRRAFRILPMLYLTLTVAILLGLAGETGGPVTLAAVLSQVLHWSNYYLIAHGPDSVVAGTIVLWSLAVEEHFYLLFPVLFRFTGRRLSRQALGWLLASACAACLCWRLVLILVLHQPGVRTELGTDTRFDGLLFGCLMAVVANPARNDASWLTLKRVRRAALLAIPERGLPRHVAVYAAERCSPPALRLCDHRSIFACFPNFKLALVGPTGHPVILPIFGACHYSRVVYPTSSGFEISTWSCHSRDRHLGFKTSPTGCRAALVQAS